MPGRENNQKITPQKNNNNQKKKISTHRRQWQLIRHSAREEASLLSDSLVFRPLWHFHLHTPIDKIKYPFGSHPSALRPVITPQPHHTFNPPPNPPLFCHLSSAASSWQHIKHKHNACPFFWLEFKEEACHWAIWGHLRKSPRGRAHFSFSFSSHHHLLFLAPSVRLPCSACIPKQLLRSAAFSWNHHQRLPARLSTGSAHRESLSHLFHLDATFWIHHMRGQTASFQNRLRTEVNYTNWVAGGKGAWLSLDSSVNPDDLGFS